MNRPTTGLTPLIAGYLDSLLPPETAACVALRAETDALPEARMKMVELTGRRTVPQIFIGSTHVGGCDDLMALDAEGALVPLLNAA